MLKLTFFDDRVVIIAKKVEVPAGPNQEDTFIRLPDSKRGLPVSSAIESGRAMEGWETIL